MENKLSLKSCSLCPRDCRIDRTSEKKGICGRDAEVYIARAALHFWEEPCISGKNGSGAVFFSGCPLHCVYCQNSVIANGEVGKEISLEELSEIFLKLQGEKANNINLVTPDHYVPQIITAIEKSRNQGLQIPIVYNTSSYVKVDTLKALEGIVDVYLPDLKYMDVTRSQKYSHAPDYFEVAALAIKEMVRQQPEAKFDFITGEEKELMQKGVIVRHLLLPGGKKDAMNLLKYLHETYGNQIFISIMNQYTPMKKFEEFPELNATIKKKNYNQLVDFAIELGIENGFIQEGKTAQESFIPEFSSEEI